MVRILVIYDSKSGNTDKMAFAVAEGAKQVKNAEVVIKKVDQSTLEDMLEADAVIVGSPTYYGQMSAKMKAFIDKSTKIHGQLNGKVGGAFTSSGGAACGAETTLFSILEALLIHGMVIQGNYDFQHFGPAAVGSPKEDDLQTCRDLGKRVAELTKRVKT